MIKSATKHALMNLVAENLIQKDLLSSAFTCKVTDVISYM